MPAFTWRGSGRNAQRAMIAGKTRSGKTTLAARMASGAWPAVFFDQKRMNDPGWQRVLGTREAVALIDSGGLTDSDQIVVQPEVNPAWPDVEQLDELARAVFFRGNCAFIADDASGIMSADPPYYLNQIATAGSARGVGLLAIVQRVHRIPRVLLTEAEHLIAFRLNGADDVERIAREGDRALEAARDLPKYAFYWFDRDADRGQLFRPLPAPGSETP